SPVKPSRGNTGFWIPESFNECAVLHRIATKPVQRATGNQFDLSTLFVQQCCCLQGALSSSYHHHVLAYEMVERRVITRMRDLLNRHMIILGGTVDVVVQARGHHDGWSLHDAPIF